MIIYNLTFETAKTVENLLQGWEYLLEYDFLSELYTITIHDSVPIQLSFLGGASRTVTLAIDNDFEILSLDEVEVTLR